jgi:hypothetical protein
MDQSPNEVQIKRLFTKSYGQSGPTPDQWKAIYANNVHFIDPTQERHGIDAYILAQNNLIQRCDDVYLKPHAIALNDDVAFIEWTMGLKIKSMVKSSNIVTTSTSLGLLLGPCQFLATLFAGFTNALSLKPNIILTKIQYSTKLAYKKN